jgi:hypothetical protein
MKKPAPSAGFFIVRSWRHVYNYGVEWGEVVYSSIVVGDSGKLSLHEDGEPVRVHQSFFTC